MIASATERILSRVKAALLNATAARCNVFRFQGSAYSSAQMPAIIVRRLTTSNDPASFENDQVSTAFDLEFLVSAREDSETVADALHLEAHAVLRADAQLKSLSLSNLRLTGTDCDTDLADTEYTRLTAHYTIDSWVLQDDQTTPA